MPELNEYEVLTLKALALDFVDNYGPVSEQYCEYCLWARHDNAVHLCLFTEVAGIVASWEEDGTLADD